MLKPILVVATGALTVLACLSAQAAEHHLRNYSAYAQDLRSAARSARAPNPARISAGLTQGRAQQLDPRMGKATFVWAGARAEVPVVGPLNARALVAERGRAFLRQQAPVMGLDLTSIEEAEAYDVQDLGHGPVIARYEQKLDGIDVFARGVNVVMTREGRPVAASGYFAKGFDRAAVLAQPFSVSAADAVAGAFRQRSGVVNAYAFTPRFTRGNYQHFTAVPLNPGTLRLTQMPRAKAVYFERAGTLEPAYYVELAALDTLQRQSTLDAYVISALDRSLLFRKDLIAHETKTYRVYADAAGTQQPFDAPLGNGYTPFPVNAKGDPITRTGAASQLVTLDHGPISTGDPWLAAGVTETIGNHVEACADHFDTPVSGIISNPTNTCVPALGDFYAQENAPGTRVDGSDRRCWRER